MMLVLCVCVCTFSAVCLSTASVACSFGEKAVELLPSDVGGIRAVLLNTGEKPERNTFNTNHSCEAVK